MKSGALVKLTKLQSVKEGQYIAGYWSEGYLINDIEVGKRINMIRHARADITDLNKRVDTLGLFESSEVLSIGEYISTENSFWKLEQL